MTLGDMRHPGLERTARRRGETDAGLGRGGRRRGRTRRRRAGDRTGEVVGAGHGCAARPGLGTRPAARRG
ncbi:hypothetical protein D8M33_09880, partial [Micrococcus sp. HSID17245]